MKTSHRTTGRAAVAAGILMTVGTQGEWILDPQRDDGTVANLPAFAMLLLATNAGFVLLVVAALGMSRTAGAPRTRAARVGGALTVAGAGLLTLFGFSTLISALVSGVAWQPAFVAFLLGMLILAVGCQIWGLSLRHRTSTPGLSTTLIAIGVFALAALLIEPDPWHDASLVGMFAGWSVLGLLVLRTPERAALTGQRSRRTTSPAPSRS